MIIIYGIFGCAIFCPLTYRKQMVTPLGVKQLRNSSPQPGPANLTCLAPSKPLTYCKHYIWQYPNLSDTFLLDYVYSYHGNTHVEGSKH